MILTNGFSFVNKEAVEAELHVLRELTQRYHACNTYNVDKTVLFWKATQRRTLSTRASPGTEVEKVRVMLALCGNADSLGKASNILHFLVSINYSIDIPLC